MSTAENVKLIKVLDGATTAGTESAPAAGIDVSGYETCTFGVQIATANAGNYLYAKGGNTASTCTNVLAGTKTVAASNGQFVALTVVKSSYPFLLPGVIRAGANTVTGDMVAVLTGPKTPPETSGDVQVTVYTPAVGSA